MVIIYSANMVDRLVDCRLRWRWQRAAAIGSDRDGGGGRRWQPVDGGGSEDGGGTAVAEAGGLRPGGGYNVRLQITADYDGDSCGDS